jgi:hypothetical protein
MSSWVEIGVQRRRATPRVSCKHGSARDAFSIDSRVAPFADDNKKARTAGKRFGPLLPDTTLAALAAGVDMRDDAFVVWAGI